MRLVLSGGGTGGHITPLLATAQAIKQQNSAAKLYYFGEKEALNSYPEASKLFKLEYSIKSGKLRRYKDDEWWHHILDVKRLSKNVADIGKLKVGYFQSLFYLNKLKPHAVFVKGGYVGLPVGLAAATLKIPLVIHESDARLGLANNLLARFAQKIGVSFPEEVFAGLPGDKLVFTGNPVRQEFFQKDVKAKKKLHLTENKPVLLVVGGSMGARKINDALLKNLGALTKEFQIVHAVGVRDYVRVKQMVAYVNHNEVSYHAFDFIKNIPTYYQAADVVLTRAGMNSLSEVAAAGIPAIVVPAPQLNDQLENAGYLKSKGAALVADESTLPEQLPKLLNEITQTDTRQRLSTEIRRLAKPKAAQKLAKIIIQSAKND